MPRTQIYFIQDGKTQRRENGVVYSMNGIATATQKTTLSNWLKYSPNDVIPHPWEIVNEVNEVSEPSVPLRHSPKADGWSESDVPEIEVVEYIAPVPVSVPVPVPVKKVPIYNIRAVYDDRGRRQGYATHPRF